MGWHPIATAPKDGSYIVLTSHSPLWRYPIVGRWNSRVDSGRSGWWDFAEPDMNHLYCVSELVSHWIPLPESPLPPAEREGGGE